MAVKVLDQVHAIPFIYFISRLSPTHTTALGSSAFALVSSFYGRQGGRVAGWLGGWGFIFTRFKLGHLAFVYWVVTCFTFPLRVMLAYFCRRAFCMLFCVLAYKDLALTCLVSTMTCLVKVSIL